MNKILFAKVPTYSAVGLPIIGDFLNCLGDSPPYHLPLFRQKLISALPLVLGQFL